MSPAIISVDQLTKYYGHQVGVERASFTVNQGEIFGFLGPNGAGKTTTLGLLHATNGTVTIFDQPVPKRSYEVRARCGYLPGNFIGYGHLTSEEFLRFSAKLRRAKPVLQERLLDRFEVAGETLKQKIRHLSHGTRQKLGIIAAFFHRPELVILDEPTIGLDPLMQETFYDLLRETQDDGRTVFFSSHVLPEVEKTCQRVAIIRDGELVALETLDNLRRRRYRRLTVILEHDIGDCELPGARLLATEGLRREFVFNGDAGALLRRLAELPVADFVFPEPDLEDVFMAFYRNEER
ncbi:MAG: ABC transporter ATP-binding protein [Candidatus Krumholzibacteriia bacterium]